MIITYYYRQSYVPFTPTGFDGQKFIIISFKEIEYEKLKEILHCYHINFKIENDKIMIKRFISNNQELLLNFSNKVIDKEWKCP